VYWQKFVAGSPKFKRALEQMLQARRGNRNNEDPATRAPDDCDRQFE
jgi:hypothetical protein